MFWKSYGMIPWRQKSWAWILGQIIDPWLVRPGGSATNDPQIFGVAILMTLQRIDLFVRNILLEKNNSSLKDFWRVFFQTKTVMMEETHDKKSEIVFFLGSHSKQFGLKAFKTVPRWWLYVVASIF